MYKEEIPVIKDHALSSPEGMYDLIEFVACTIRRPFSWVRDARLKLAAGQTVITSVQSGGLSFAKARSTTILDSVSTAKTTEDVMRVFLTIDGIGLAKSAFCAQLLGWDVGCLDTWNYKELGVEPIVLKKNRGEPHLGRSLESYLELSSRKSSEKWWNDWCSGIASSGKNKRLLTKESVSKEHVSCIILT